MEQKVIAAIHKTIRRKWDPICMGYKADEGDDDCELCSIMRCSECPFEAACDTGTYRAWAHHVIQKHGGATPKEHLRAACSRVIFKIYCPTCAERAEAVLEDLILLLPPDERTIYGG